MEARISGSARLSKQATVALGVGSVVLAVALAFASVELPRLISGFLIESFDFPGFDSGREVEAAEAWVGAHGLRVIGYACFIAVLVAVIAGLVGGRRRLAAAGAVALLLPLFGHFAASMFFLAGLGMLRVIVLPILDRGYGLMALGDVAFVPYMALVHPIAVLGLDARDVVIWGSMIAGMALFTTGVLAWFLEKAGDGDVAREWVYRFSRHPQYAGWILWSWGLMLYVSVHSELYHFKIAYGVPSSLPWLLSTMVIIGVALSEEIHMERRLGDGYRSYAQRTPFLIPVPRVAERILSAPARLVLGKPRPETGAEVVGVIALYAALLMMLSLPFVLFGWPAATGWYAFPYNVAPFVSG